MVFTDPPYGGEWVSNYAGLVAFAFSALEDGGYFVSYTGDAHYSKLARAAEDAGFLPYGYIWIRHSHGSQSLYYPKKTCPGKLVFVFTKGRARLSRSYPGELNCGDPSLKDDHEWQQALGEATRIIEAFTERGELVVDPCVGSGTVPLAAARLGRLAVGIEKDAATHRAAVWKVERQLSLDRNFGVGNITAPEWDKAMQQAYESLKLPQSQRAAAYPEAAETFARASRFWLSEGKDVE